MVSSGRLLLLDNNPSTLLLDDFEHGDLTKYETNHTFVDSYTLSMSDDKSKRGINSLKLSYHFGGWTSGNGAMYIQFNECLQTEMMPVKLGMWVYGDGKSPWLRANFIDGEGSRKTVNLTKGNIDWIGWKYVDTTIDNSWKLPIKLEKIYAVEIDKSLQGNHKMTGEIFFDMIQFVYVDNIDLKGPVFTDIYPKGSVIYDNSFIFSARVIDDMSGVDRDSIQVKVNGEIVRHSYSDENGIIRCQIDDIGESDVHLEVVAYDKAGNRSLPSINKIITIDLSPDMEKPTISNMTPSKDVVSYSDTPRITFNVRDEKSGINHADIKVVLDDDELDTIFHEETGWCYAYPEQPIDEGQHIVTITVKDRAGNQLGPIEERFFTKSLAKLGDYETVTIPVIPDTHSPDYLSLLCHHIAQEPSHLVIHMGDMVEEAKKNEYKDVKEVLSNLSEHALLTVPGNHESFQGNLDLYQTYFGSPTYHLNVGQSLLIVLNSAFDQSLSKSDSTQFHYLQRLLRENKQKNIIIATHVPVKDTLGTSHQMNGKDAEKLEYILSEYKRKHEDVSITVLFGHLHVLQSWEKEGVTYIITGNGAGKSYVSHDKGNLLGYGVLEIGRAGVKYNFNPIVEELFIKRENDAESLRPEKNSKIWEIPQGTTEQLHVFGRVHVLTSHYTADITQHRLINKNWKSSNDDILSISPNGMVTGKKQGTAIITVILRESFSVKKANITIEVTSTEHLMNEKS